MQCESNVFLALQMFVCLSGHELEFMFAIRSGPECGLHIRTLLLEAWFDDTESSASSCQLVGRGRSSISNQFGKGRREGRVGK